MIFLPKRTALVSSLCGENNKYNLQGVHILEYEGGFYRVEATDGHYVGVVRGKNERDFTQTAPGQVFDYGVPNAAWNAGFKLCKNPATKKDEPLGFEATAEEVTMTVSDCVGRSVLAEGRFPPVDKILPSAPPLFSVRVDPKLLKSLLYVAAAFADDGLVHVHFWPDKNMLGVTTKSGLQTFDGLMCCLEAPKEGGAS